MDHAAQAMISARGLSAFGDRLIVRDPRGRSGRPSLVETDRGLRVQGPFQLRRHLVPTRERGVVFVDATGDPNPIHRTGEIVPGAFVAAQFVSMAEVLLPTLRLRKLRATFSGVCWYGRALRLTVKASPTEDGLSFDAVAFQDDREVASAKLEGEWVEVVPRLELPIEQVDSAWLLRVVEFYRSLGVDAEVYFHKDAGADLSYPIAFLSSLPSGSMVERLDGNGGLLNRLTLSFGETKLPVAGPPEVSLELPKRLRASFNKILTAVREGMQTAVQGTALVLPRPSDADLFGSK